MASVPVAEHNLACLSTVAAGPKWSFGGRTNRPSSAVPVPGPGAYNPHFELSKETAPQYGFGSQKRGGIAGGKQSSPGPGAYQPQYNRGKQAASWTMGGRLGPSGGRSLTPGPGTYSNVIPKSSSPAYGIGTSSRTTFSAPNSPGPGAYDAAKNFGGQSPQWSVGVSQRSQITNLKVSSPGPGTYNPPALTGSGGPMYSMASRPHGVTKDRTPGPGTYTPRCPEKESNKFSFSGRTPLARVGGDAPGPGTYNPAEITVKRRPPAWGFGNSQRAGFATNASPGPGQYNPERKTGAPAWSFGGEAKMKGLVVGRDTPAPGTYTLGTTVGQGIKYSIAGSRRTGMPTASDSPGPCTYMPMLNNDSPKWTFGSSTRTKLTPSAVSPGPGAYNPVLAREGVGWTMSGRHGGDVAGGVKKPSGGNDKIGTTYSTFGF